MFVDLGVDVNVDVDVVLVSYVGCFCCLLMLKIN